MARGAWFCVGGGVVGPLSLSPVEAYAAWSKLHRFQVARQFDGLPPWSPL